MQNKKLMFFLVVLLILIMGGACGNIASNVSNQKEDLAKKDNLTTFTKLNESLGNIKDQASAVDAIDELEKCANQRTNRTILGVTSKSGIKLFALNYNLKQKIADMEVKFRGKNGVILSTLSTDDDDLDYNMTEEEFLKQQEEECKKGLSCQDVADALNATMKKQGLTTQEISNIEFTGTEIEIFKDHVEDVLPNSSKPGRFRISPEQALIIGYVAASDEDFKKSDGEVKLLANNDQINSFVEEIITKGENNQ